jgi:5-deoxy-glucuronate isomerase
MTPKAGPSRRRSPLLRRAFLPGPDGTIVAVEPTPAGWAYVGFAAHRLRAGQAVRCPADDCERLAHVLEGRAPVQAGPQPDRALAEAPAPSRPRRRAAGLR